MWLTGGYAAAAATEVPVSGGNDALLALIGGIAVAVIGGATTVLVASINSRNSKTTPSPPAPSTSGGTDMAFRDYVVGELAVVRRRLDDGDERDEIQDRRLDQLEDHADLENPEWRRHQ